MQDAPSALASPTPPPPDPVFIHALPGASVFARFKAFLKRHPVIFLALLTPGIPEYLSGSSPFSNIIYNPAWFVLGLLFNLGMYVPGVLLIREAQIRWKKGWATVLLLGAAYAIVEEGVGLSTMFNPNASALGGTGGYGHYLGVNWVWVPDVMMIHMIFSIGVPLLLFGYAFPELKGKSLLTDKGIQKVAAILCIDIMLLAIFVWASTKYWMGDGVLFGALLAIAGLCVLAHWLPSDLFTALPGPPTSGPLSFAIAGGVFYVGSILMVSVLENSHEPALLVALSIPLYCFLFLWWVLLHAGSYRNERQLLAFSFFLILPIIVVGLALQIVAPFVIVADLLAILFFWQMYNRFATSKRNPVTGSPPPPPAVAHV